MIQGKHDNTLSPRFDFCPCNNVIRQVLLIQNCVQLQIWGNTDYEVSLNYYKFDNYNVGSISYVLHFDMTTAENQLTAVLTF